MLTPCHSFRFLPQRILLGGLILALPGLLIAEQAQISTQAPTQTQAQAPAEAEEPLCNFPPIPNMPVADPNIPPNRTHLQADQADMSEKNITHFSGSVVIQRDRRRIEADKAKYYHRSEDFDAEGHVRLVTNELEVKANDGHMNLKQDRGILHQTQYRLLPENANGKAATLIIESPTRVIMEDATYTTCSPDKMDWELSASEITLNKETRQGTASHVVVKYMGVPFLYLPYLRFPLGNDRLSGFLLPSFAVTDERGTEISVPYYWNIAPEMDATVTAHNMTRHGLMWENEFRYLTDNSDGQVELDYLENDKEYGSERKRFKWHHQGQANAGWSSTLDYQRVGDNQHLADFGTDLNSASTTHLEQRATLSYNAESWQFNSLVQNYQTLSGSQPYRKLPQLQLASRLPEQDNHLNFNASTEWVRFDHPDKSYVRADRSHLQPTVSLPLRNQAAFFIPRVTGYFTHYQLSDNATQEDKSPSRSLAVSSLDTGLYLERDTSFGDTPVLQTFEPRLFYVYAPYRDQSDLPVFDSGEPGFSFDRLFRENRFSGTDRIGDANRLTVALTSRYLHEQTGAELFSASVGRVYYYADRRVTLPGKDPETTRGSDYVARIAAHPFTYWSLSSDIQWDSDTRQTRFSTTRLSYERDKDHMVTFSHRYRRDQLSTRDMGVVWRFNPHWRFLAAYQYDNRHQRSLEKVYGVNYDSCCWGLRILAREYYNGTRNGQDLYENAIYLVLELKGLSSFGNDNQAEGILRQTIPGYNQQTR